MLLNILNIDNSNALVQIPDHKQIYVSLLKTVIQQHFCKQEN